MAKKAARKLRSDANGSTLKTTSEHPALKLLSALNGLHGTCFNANLFRDLGARRKRAREVQLNWVKVAGAAASRRAEERSAAGASFEDSFSEFHDVRRLASEPPPSNEPAEYTKRLREVLDNGRGWCERAREALRAGGAKGMDAALTPGRAGRSVEIGKKVREAESVFIGLWVAVGDPHGLVDDRADAMTRLGKWFGQTFDELGAVIETYGLDAPPATSTVPTELLAKLLASHAEGMERVEKAVLSAGAGDNRTHTVPHGNSGNPPDPHADWITVTKAAKALGIGTGEVSRHCEAGKLVTNGQKKRLRRIDPASVTHLAIEIQGTSQVRVFVRKQSTKAK